LEREQDDNSSPATPPSTVGASHEAFQNLLDAAGRGESTASEQLLPLVYEHLRELARAKLAKEPSGQTLQPTALVHEAYLKLVRSDQTWNDRRHFFAAAALAMRRILVDRARAKRGSKRGGDLRKFSLEQWDRPADGATGGTQYAAPDQGDDMDWLALEEAMRALEAQDSELAQIVHLRYFAGLTLEETALAMGKSSRTINRDWMVARAWLLRHMQATQRE